MKRKNMLLMTAIMAGLGSAVMAQGMHGRHGQMPNMDQMMPSASDSPATKGLKEAHMSMMHGMTMSFTGNPDVDFVQGMIPHHQGAIDMAKVQLQHGKDPEIKKLAEKIIADQEREIAEMQAWLKKNKK
jgi:uncharacterized protein (DUF305 family)